MKHSEINVAVFTQTTDLSNIVAILRDSSSTHPFLLLSSHKLFEHERDRIIQYTKQRIQFACFADFLTDEEMDWCDTHAYEQECKESGPKLRSA